MEQYGPNPPAPGAIPPHSLPVEPVRWTPERQRLFLTSLLATGNVTQAARAAGMSPASAHRLRKRLVGTPFDRTWARACPPCPESGRSLHRSGGAGRDHPVASL